MMTLTLHRTLGRVLALIALTLLLTGCGLLGRSSGPSIASSDLTLCAATVPEPEASESTCETLTFRYVETAE